MGGFQVPCVRVAQRVSKGRVLAVYMPIMAGFVLNIAYL